MSARRKRARKAIAMRELAAMFASMLLPEKQRDELRAAKVPAKKIIALFEPHHIVFFAIGGSDKWWNLHPMPTADHRARSPADTSTVAKVRRISREHEDFRRRALAVEKKPRQRSSRWPQGRKLQSRSNFERRP